MDLYMDKGDVVRIAAIAATKTLLKLFPPEAARLVFRQLESILEKGKWRTKVGALDSIRGFIDRAKEEVARELGAVLPRVEKAMHDTKPEVGQRFFTIPTSSKNQGRYLLQQRNVRRLCARLLQIRTSLLIFLSSLNACPILHRYQRA